jgi:hypothetical protein
MASRSRLESSIPSSSSDLEVKIWLRSVSRSSAVSTLSIRLPISSDVWQSSRKSVSGSGSLMVASSEV